VNESRYIIGQLQMMPEGIQWRTDGVFAFTRVFFMPWEDVRHQRLIGIATEAKTKIRSKCAERVGHS